MRIEAAGQPGDRRADRECHHLVDGEIDPHASCRGLAVADGEKGAAGGGTQQVERAEHHRDQQREADDIEAVAVAAERETEQIERLDPHPLVAVGDALPARGDLLDDEAEGDGGDDQIDAGKTQRREPDERPDRAGNQPGERQIHQERDAEPLQVCGRIGADRQERRMAERNLAGEAGENQQSDADDRVDEHEYQLALQIRSDHERR